LRGVGLKEDGSSFSGPIRLGVLRTQVRREVLILPLSTRHSHTLPPEALTHRRLLDPLHFCSPLVGFIHTPYTPLHTRCGARPWSAPVGCTISGRRSSSSSSLGCGGSAGCGPTSRCTTYLLWLSLLRPNEEVAPYTPYTLLVPLCRALHSHLRTEPKGDVARGRVGYHSSWVWSTL
jgi:hypothetical protein